VQKAVDWPPLRGTVLAASPWLFGDYALAVGAAIVASTGSVVR